MFAAGSFDGVHLGHASLIKRAKEEALRRGAEAWALTLEPHPLSVLSPDRAPPLLSPGRLRLEALAATGLHGALVLPFTREMADWSPQRFVETAFGPWLGQKGRCIVCSGPDWRFGTHRRGRPSDLPSLSAGAVESIEVPLLQWGGAPVSSTRIREALLAGDVRLAARLLGRPWRSRERALPAPSRGVGTRVLGAPTANVLPESPAMPPPGAVFALDVRIGASGGDEAPDAAAFSDAAPLRAVAAFGWRPTFPEARPDTPVLEIHIPGWDGSPLYGKPLQLDWLEKLRDERAFATPSALAAQIRDDIAAAQAL